MIEYGNSDGMHWDANHMEARFTIHVDGRPVLCRVSWEAITDHFDNSKDEGGCLDAAKEHFDDITDEIMHKIATRQFEADGSILLRTRDW